MNLRSIEIMRTYIEATRRLISTSLSTFRSSNVASLNLPFRSVLAHPAMGHGAGPWLKMRSTHDSHILW